MKRTCCNTMAILLASLLLAGPAIGNDEGKTRGDSSAGPAIGKDSPSMSERKASDDASVSSSAHKLNTRVASSSLSQDQIRELQRLLSDRGHSAGNADGIIGPRTRAAIRQFQTANELTVNGTPDQATLRALAPDAQKQEFFGVAPAYGERGNMNQQPLDKEPVKTIGPDPMHTDPMRTEPMNTEPKNTEPMKTEPMKKGY